MASVALFDYRLQVVNENGVVLNHERHLRFSPGTGNGKRETVTLAAGFNALTVPTGSKFLAVLLGSAVSLTLKGITGDSSSLTIAPATSPVGFDMLIPLGTAPVLGILNGGSGVSVELLWF